MTFFIFTTFRVQRNSECFCTWVTSDNNIKKYMSHVYSDTSEWTDYRNVKYITTNFVKLKKTFLFERFVSIVRFRKFVKLGNLINFYIWHSKSYQILFL